VIADEAFSFLLVERCPYCRLYIGGAMDVFSRICEFSSPTPCIGPGGFRPCAAGRSFEDTTTAWYGNVDSRCMTGKVRITAMSNLRVAMKFVGRPRA